MKTSRNFREYKVWQEAVDFATEVYKVTVEMPWFEKKGLCDQLQRAVVSISSNIAEGSARPSDADFAHFLDTALGSAYEVETQLLIAKNVGYLGNVNVNPDDNVDLDVDVGYDDNLDVELDEPNDNFQELMDGIHSIERQLNALISSIRNSQSQD